MNTRTKDLAKSVETYLSKTPNIPTDDVRNLPYADVPFHLTVAADVIFMNYADNIAAGDYAFIGTTMSSRRVPDDQSKLVPYMDSIQNLRRSPSLNREISSAMQFDLAIYNHRYSAEVAAATKPTMHGDQFKGHSRTNVVFGEFVTGITYMTFSGGQASFSVDTAANAFATVATGASLFDGDNFDFPAGVQVNGQLGSDHAVNNQVLINGDLSIEVRSHMTGIFYDHVLFVQMRNDAWFEPIEPKHLKGVKNGYQCTRANEASFIPSYSKNDMAPQFRFIVAQQPNLVAAAVVSAVNAVPITAKEEGEEEVPIVVDSVPNKEEEVLPVVVQSPPHDGTVN